jgi:hypothetical protein
MSGFPNRIVRSNLGPTYRDRNAVENPEVELGADYANLLLHQAVGVQLISPVADLIASWTGAVFVVAKREEAWNVDHSQAHPVLARTGAGVYTYQFAASYLDMDGESVITALADARLTARSTTAGYANRVSGRAWVDDADATLVHIEIYDAAGSAADAPFWLEVI